MDWGAARAKRGADILGTNYLVHTYVRLRGKGTARECVNMLQPCKLIDHLPDLS